MPFKKDMTKLEPHEVQIKRIGDGIFEIARYRDGADFHYEPFNVSDIPARLTPVEKPDVD